MTSQPIASSEARGEEEETGLPNASSEARGEEDETGPPIGLEKERLFIQLSRAKQEAKKRDWSTNCLERSKGLRREIGQPIASSEASSLEAMGSPVSFP